MQTEIWLSASEAAVLCGLSKVAIFYKIKNGSLSTKTITANGGRQYRILLSSLPAEAQLKYFDVNKNELKIDHEPFDLSQIPDYNRPIYTKRKTILRASEGLRGKRLDEWIKDWNLNQPADYKTSRSDVYWIRDQYVQHGDWGLAGKYGNRLRGWSTPDEYQEDFDSLMLDMNRRSAEDCYLTVKGKALMGGVEIPGISAFINRYNKTHPESYRDLRRYGYQYWNRNWSNYVDRDYSDLHAGEVWVSDHHQLDMAIKLSSGKMCRPWITVWKDFKTGRWLGWYLHPASPNTDHILHCFYITAVKHGIPLAVYIDNGKDYRSISFSGGRKLTNNVKLEVDEKRVRSLCQSLNIDPIFAKPYGAQSKSIERDFKHVKERYSKKFDLYTGGNTKERPENFMQLFDSSRVHDLAMVQQQFDMFIEEIFNEFPSYGKVTQGRSRNQAWHEELAVNNPLRMVHQDEMKLFAMAVSRPAPIGRQGITLSRREGLYYYAIWMEGMKDSKIEAYMRRDPNNYGIAWVFNASNDEYLGKAELRSLTAHAWAKDGVQKEQLSKVLETKKVAENITKMLAGNIKNRFTPEEEFELQAFAIKEMNKNTKLPTPKESKLYVLSQMAEAVRREKLRTGTDDLDLKPLNNRNRVEDEYAGWEE